MNGTDIHQHQQTSQSAHQQQQSQQPSQQPPPPPSTRPIQQSPQDYFQAPTQQPTSNFPRQRPRDDLPDHPPPFAPYDDRREGDHPPERADSGDDSAADDQLSFQALNADGTPKRPMNAFLLYAKKRRPQISNNHPTMRTGEISKVLSKEWQNMPKTEKQYYQDKAKKLKDTFNLRWPDYVYKRRPNNSRKKRRNNPGPDSPIIEDGSSRRESEGVDNHYGEESGGDDADGSPSVVQHRPPTVPESSIPGRMYPPPNAPGYSSYEDSYNSYPYYPPGQAPSQQQPPPPANRLPPVWGSHEPARPQYDGPNRSSSGASANYSPINEEGQQWSAGPRSGNGVSNPPGWQNILQANASSTGPISSARGLPRTTSADQSPIQSPAEAPYSANRPRDWNAGPTGVSNNRQQFQTLNAPLYPSNQHRPGRNSPPIYSGGSGPSPSMGGSGPSGLGGYASTSPSITTMGRSPMLPAISTLDGHSPHASYPTPQQPSSNLRETGYSPHLPPIGGGSSTHSAQSSDSNSRPFNAPSFAGRDGPTEA